MISDILQARERAGEVSLFNFILSWHTWIKPGGYQHCLGSDADAFKVLVKESDRYIRR
jgi:hypothetical protein